MSCDIIHEHDGRDMGDKEYFAIICGAMKVLNFSADEMWDIWQLVAMIMHLGNISFGGKCGININHYVIVMSFFLQRLKSTTFQCPLLKIRAPETLQPPFCR